MFHLIALLRTASGAYTSPALTLADMMTFNSTMIMHASGAANRAATLYWYQLPMTNEGVLGAH